ncbi:MAG: NADH-quinone oxidoreductase subunit I [Candidatus Hydrothermales bacterium]
MSQILNVLKVLKVATKNFFRETFTIMYPDKKREIPERFRGPLFGLPTDNNGDLKCIACKLCEQICPSEIINVTPAEGKNKSGRTYPEKFTIELQACLACELCVQVCPTDAIVMLKVPGWAALSRDELLLTLEKMVEYGKKYESSIIAGNILRNMQTPPRREKVAAT